MTTRTFSFIVMGVVGLFYLALTPVVLRHLDPVTGDEPFYIMTAISMIRDRSLDETANYANRDYEEFYPPDPLPLNWQGWPAFPRTLPPHPAITEREGLYTKHGLGLSAMIAIPYEYFGRIGALLFVLCCGVLLSGQMFLLARESQVPDKLAAASAVALAMTLPLAPYSLLVFPEVPAALLILYAIRRLAIARNSLTRWIAVGAAVGFLPWLHQRFAVVSIVFAILILIELWRSRSRNTLVALVPVAAGGLSIILYNVWLYGQVTQNTEDHAGFSGLAGTLNGFAGLFLDAQWGLLIAAPVLIVAIAAIPVWFHRARRLATISFAAVVPYLVVVAAYREWWGEWGPPARYLVPVVPILAAPLACWMNVANRKQQIAVATAFGSSVVLATAGYLNPQRFYHHPNGVNNLFAYLSERVGVDLGGWLVPYQFYSAAPRIERIVFALLAATLVSALGFWISRQARLAAID
jgi:hypothetical protein